jgi:hypothetical protein
MITMRFPFHFIVPGIAHAILFLVIHRMQACSSVAIHHMQASIACSVVIHHAQFSSLRSIACRHLSHVGMQQHGVVLHHGGMDKLGGTMAWCGGNLWHRRHRVLDLS